MKLIDRDIRKIKLDLEKYKKRLLRSKVKVKCHQLAPASRVHRWTYFHRVTSASDQQFMRFVRTHRQTDRQTDRRR